MDFWKVAFLNWPQEVIVWDLFDSGQFSKPSWLSNIAKIPAAFKLELHSLAPKLSIEPRFGKRL